MELISAIRSLSHLLLFLALAMSAIDLMDIAERKSMLEVPNGAVNVRSV